MKLSKSVQKQLAVEQIAELFSQAVTIFPSKPEYAHKYIARALEFRNKYKVQLTKAQKRSCCKSCHHLLIQGKNCITRVKNKMLLIHCKDCNAIRRFSLRKKIAK